MSATYGIAGKLSTGIGTDWVRQSSTPGTEVKRANAMDDMGNEIASTIYDEREPITEVWKAKGTSSLGIPDLGALCDSYVITSIKVETSNTDYATLTIVGHKNTDGTPSQTVETGFAALITKAYGAINLSGGTGTCISSSIEATCEHVEVADGTGDTIAGENHNFMIVVSETFIDGGTLGNTYDNTGETNNETNTGYRTKTLTGTKAIAVT